MPRVFLNVSRLDFNLQWNGEQSRSILHCFRVDEHLKFPSTRCKLSNGGNYIFFLPVIMVIKEFRRKKSTHTPFPATGAENSALQQKDYILPLPAILMPVKHLCRTSQ